MFVRWLGGGFKYFLCSPLFGEDFQFDEHIFQMGWNHQLDEFCFELVKYSAWINQQLCSFPVFHVAGPQWLHLLKQIQSYRHDTVDGSEIRRENHLGFIKPRKEWEKQTNLNWWVFRISEPSTVPLQRCEQCISPDLRPLIMLSFVFVALFHHTNSYSIPTISISGVVCRYLLIP